LSARGVLTRPIHIAFSMHCRPCRKAYDGLYIIPMTIVLPPWECPHIILGVALNVLNTAGVGEPMEKLRLPTNISSNLRNKIEHIG